MIICYYNLIIIEINNNYYKLLICHNKILHCLILINTISCYYKLIICITNYSFVSTNYSYFIGLYLINIGLLKIDNLLIQSVGNEINHSSAPSV